MRALTMCITMMALLAAAGPAVADDEGAEPTPEVETSIPVAPILISGLGATMVAVGAGLGWQADEEYERYDDAPSERLADDVERHALAANILMISGGVVVVGSVIWMIADAAGDDEGEAEVELSTARWRPTAGPGHVALTVEF